MKSRKRREYAKAFVVTPDSLTRIVADLPCAAQEIAFTVKCSDGSSLKPASLDEVLGLLNPRSRAIKQITIETIYPCHPSVNIEFEVDELSTVTYVVAGEDAEVLHMSRLIEMHLEPLKRSFSFLSVGGWTYGYPIVIFFSGSTLSLAALGNRFPPGKLRWAAQVLGLLLMAFAPFSAPLRRFLFPSMEFLIGDGLSRHKRAAAIRKQLGFALVVALAIGVVSSLIASSISK